MKKSQEVNKVIFSTTYKHGSNSRTNNQIQGTFYDFEGNSSSLESKLRKFAVDES